MIDSVDQCWLDKVAGNEEWFIYWLSYVGNWWRCWHLSHKGVGNEAEASTATKKRMIHISPVQAVLMTWMFMHTGNCIQGSSYQDFPRCADIFLQAKQRGGLIDYMFPLYQWKIIFYFNSYCMIHDVFNHGCWIQAAWSLGQAGKTNA